MDRGSLLPGAAGRMPARAAPGRTAALDLVVLPVVLPVVLLGLLLTAADVAAEEPVDVAVDGAVAPPGRWTGPEGPPSRSRRSRALPVTRGVAEAWSVALPGEPVSPPVTWDGTAYLLCRLERGHELIAVDLDEGRVRASKRFPKSQDVAIHVWNDVVYLATSTRRISGYEFRGDRFVSRDWFSVADPTHLCVFENEIYVTDAGGLERRSPGMRAPFWTRDGLDGPIALYGRTVVARGGRGESLVSLTRRDGDRFSATRLGYPSAEDIPDDGDVTLGAERILVRPGGAIPTRESGLCTHGFVDYTMVDGKVRLVSLKGLWTFTVTPAVYERGLLAFDGRSKWQHWRKGRGRTVADRKYTPDLFRSVVPATVLGDVAYFGTWAADLETLEVLWRLPVDEVRFGAVPADRIVIIVDGKGNLRGYRSRIGR